MTANELADELEKHELEGMEYGFDQHLFASAAMLRQQKIEIEALKNQLSYLESKVYGGTTK